MMDVANSLYHSQSSHTGITCDKGIYQHLFTASPRNRFHDNFRFADDPAVTEPAIPSSGLLIKQTAPLASENSVSGRTLARSESI